MLKKQKGITLIALIITIIVMLILVGVTINVALNGGLFTKADDAKKLTQLAMDKEELEIEKVTAYDEENKVVDLGTLKTNLANKGWKDIIISGDKLTCTSPKGNTFTLAITGKIIEGEYNIGEEPIGFNWQDLGLKVESNTNYVFYGMEAPLIMGFTNDGYIILTYGNLTLYNEKAEEKQDYETEKTKINVEELGEMMISTNNEDNADSNIYAETIEGTIIFEKIEILPKEEFNVYTGQSQDASSSYILIEISETEAVIDTNLSAPQKITIYDSSDLKEFEDLSSYKLDGNDEWIPYTKVARVPEEPTGAVYWDTLDIWYIYGLADGTIRILEESPMERNTSMTQEEIQAIISEAN